jgi:hypothetical protein
MDFLGYRGDGLKHTGCSGSVHAADNQSHGHLTRSRRDLTHLKSGSHYLVGFEMKEETSLYVSNWS